MLKLNLPWKSLCVAAFIAAASTASADTSIVPMVQTPMSRAELVSALREGHVRVFGREASKNRLAMAWGQVALENGQGRLTFNHNLGNVVAGRGQLGYRLGDHQPYRSFISFADGAEAYWRVISRCMPALLKFDTGRPLDAALWLKRCRYFEAEISEYAPGLTKLYTYAQETVIPEEEHEREERQSLIAAAESILNPGGNQ
jgi:hypothetical protein